MPRHRVRSSSKDLTDPLAFPAFMKADISLCTHHSPALISCTRSTLNHSQSKNDRMRRARQRAMPHSETFCHLPPSTTSFLPPFGSKPLVFSRFWTSLLQILPSLSPKTATASRCSPIISSGRLQKPMRLSTALAMARRTFPTCCCTMLYEEGTQRPTSYMQGASIPFLARYNLKTFICNFLRALRGTLWCRTWRPQTARRPF